MSRRDLAAELGHAEHLARLPEPLLQHSMSRHLWFLWLLGRSDEVRVFARDVVSDRSEGRIDDEAASDAIREYLAGLDRTIHAWLGAGYVLPCCRQDSGEVRVVKARFAPSRRPSIRRVVSRVARDSAPTFPPFESGVVRAALRARARSAG